MSRRIAAVWLAGLSAVLLNLALSCPTRGQEIARVPVAAGSVTVARSEGVILVTVVSDGDTIEIRIPAISGEPEPEPDDPGAPVDPMAAAVDQAFAAIPSASRLAIRDAAIKEVNEAIAVVDRLKSVDDAVRVLLSRVIFNLGDVGPIFAAQLTQIAASLHEGTGSTLERLEQLKAILEARS